MSTQLITSNIRFELESEFSLITNQLIQNFINGSYIEQQSNFTITLTTTIKIDLSLSSIQPTSGQIPLLPPHPASSGTKQSATLLSTDRYTRRLAVMQWHKLPGQRRSSLQSGHQTTARSQSPISKLYVHGKGKPIMSKSYN